MVRSWEAYNVKNANSDSKHDIFIIILGCLPGTKKELLEEKRIQISREWFPLNTESAECEMEGEFKNEYRIYELN